MNQNTLLLQSILLSSSVVHFVLTLERKVKRQNIYIFSDILLNSHILKLRQALKNDSEYNLIIYAIYL